MLRFWFVPGAVSNAAVGPPQFEIDAEDLRAAIRDGGPRLSLDPSQVSFLQGFIERLPTHIAEANVITNLVVFRVLPGGS